MTITATAIPQQEIQVYLPRPHVGQQEILNQRNKHNVVDCGRRWGKSKLGIYIAMKALMEGKRVGWFAPNYKYLADVWRELKFRLAPITVEKQEISHYIRVIGGGVLECWTLDDKDAGRSRAYHIILVDEAAMVPDLMEIWEKAIEPTLTDYDGDAWFFSTPNGRNAFYIMFTWGTKGFNKKQEWSAWQRPTASNPYIRPEVLAAIRKNRPKLIYAQEYLAEFIQEGSAVFPNAIRAARAPWIRAPYPGEFVFGVDWARTTDYTVAVVGDIRTKQVVDFMRFSRVHWHTQKRRLKLLDRRWNPTAIYADATAIGSAVVEELEYVEKLPMVPIVFTNKIKVDLIDSLAVSLEQGEFTYPPFRSLVGEMQSYELKKTKTGKLTYGAPADMHDDWVTALALCNHGMKNTIIETRSNPSLAMIPEYVY